VLAINAADKAVPYVGRCDLLEANRPPTITSGDDRQRRYCGAGWHARLHDPR
jgi:hypothetical protein